MSYGVDVIAGSVSQDVRDQRPATAPYNETTEGAAAPAGAAITRAFALEARALSQIGIPANWIAEAAAQARWTGAPIAATLLASRRIGEDDFYRALARGLGAPFVAHPVAPAPRFD